MSTGLENLGPVAESVVQVSDGKQFSVRGLGLEPIVAIYTRHQGELSALFERLAGQGEGGVAISLDQAAALGGALLAGAPDIAAEIIAAGAGEVTDGNVAIAKSLPFPVQLDALDKIATLTFTSDMPPKKVLEIVIRAGSGVAKTMTNLTPLTA